MQSCTGSMHQVVFSGNVRAVYIREHNLFRYPASGERIGRGRSRNGPRSDVPRHRRYWLAAADELPYRGYGCGCRAGVFPVERTVVATATDRPSQRSRPGNTRREIDLSLSRPWCNAVMHRECCARYLYARERTSLESATAERFLRELCPRDIRALRVACRT